MQIINNIFKPHIDKCICVGMGNHSYLVYSCYNDNNNNNVNNIYYYNNLPCGESAGS